MSDGISSQMEIQIQNIQNDAISDQAPKKDLQHSLLQKIDYAPKLFHCNSFEFHTFLNDFLTL